MLKQPANKLKWADCQRAVTILWLPAHSILNRIGGDIPMVDLFRPLSSRLPGTGGSFSAAPMALCKKYAATASMLDFVALTHPLSFVTFERL
jgi:hypothetical protein